MLYNKSAILYASTIGAHNPLRYRGYVYDNETGFYYLQSRYYDPTTGRFLNADAFASTGQGLLGNNMFVYCLNNPVRYHDVSGYMVEEDCITEDPVEFLIPDRMHWDQLPTLEEQIVITLMLNKQYLTEPLMEDITTAEIVIIIFQVVFPPVVPNLKT